LEAPGATPARSYAAASRAYRWWSRGVLALVRRVPARDGVRRPRRPPRRASRGRGDLGGRSV